MTREVEFRHKKLHCGRRSKTEPLWHGGSVHSRKETSCPLAGYVVRSAYQLKHHSHHASKEYVIHVCISNESSPFERRTYIERWDGIPFPFLKISHSIWPVHLMTTTAD